MSELKTADDVRKAWEGLNGAPDEDSGTDRAARFLLAAGTVGLTRRSELAMLSGLNPFALSATMRRARAAGVVKGGQVLRGDWFDEETGGINFIMDAMTIAGLLTREPA
jgi:hypothetical protein